VLDGGAPSSGAPSSGAPSSGAPSSGAAIATMGRADLELRRVPLDGGPPAVVFPTGVVQSLSGALDALDVSRDAGSLVLSLDDGVLRWDRGAPAPIELGRHRAAVKAVAIADDGRVASGADDGSVMLWTRSAASPRVGHDRAITALAFASDGR